MLAIARQTAIREKLREFKSVRIADLAQQLQVTRETIRRDLREMERRGELIRTHGGAYTLEVRYYEDAGKTQAAGTSVITVRQADGVYYLASMT